MTDDLSEEYEQQHMNGDIPGESTSRAVDTRSVTA